MTEEANKYVNNLGEYESIDTVWERYPEGGHEGDYVIIAGERFAWDKYTLSWGGIKDDSTPARKIYEVPGDLYVESNIEVGGRVSANYIEGEENIPDGAYVEPTQMVNYVQQQLSSYPRKTEIASNLLVQAASAALAQSQSASNPDKIYYTVEA